MSACTKSLPPSGKAHAALFLAPICELRTASEILVVDIDPTRVSIRTHKRIIHFLGYGADFRPFAQTKAAAVETSNVPIVLDHGSSPQNIQN
jgi:hypothetical protein